MKDPKAFSITENDDEIQEIIIANKTNSKLVSKIEDIDELDEIILKEKGTEEIFVVPQYTKYIIMTCLSS